MENNKDGQTNAPFDMNGPDAHDPSIIHQPTMLTSAIALKVYPTYEKVFRHFHENPKEFADAFSRTWFKLTHRDMGPGELYFGPKVPQKELLWQDVIPAVDYKVIDDADIADLKKKVLESKLSVSQMVATAWASVSTFRGSDMQCKVQIYLLFLLLRPRIHFALQHFQRKATVF